MIYAYKSLLPGGCGMNVINEYSAQNYNQAWGPQTIDQMQLHSGTGLTIGSFKNDNVCKEMYEEMCKRFPIVFQSKPMKNKRHGVRKAFYVIWDCNKKKVA